MAYAADLSAWETPFGRKMGYDTMSAWDGMAFESGNIWSQAIPWNGGPGRPSSQDDYQPPASPAHKPLAAVELPAAPLFRDACSRWSPPPSLGVRSRGRTPSSPRVDSAMDSPVMVLLTRKEKRVLGEKLYAAASAGDLDQIQLLLSLGAPVNSRVRVEGLYEAFKPPKAGTLSPLAGAASNGQLDAVELLLAEGAELNPDLSISSSSPLHEAIRANDIELSTILLELGARVNKLNCYKTTPLMYAAKYGSAEMVKLILGYKPDLHQLSFIGAAAIHWAMWRDRPEILELLLQAGADKDHPQAEGSTPLHYSAGAGLLRTVECLLAWGADPLKRNEDCSTPLQLAEEGGYAQIAALLKGAAPSRLPP